MQSIIGFFSLLHTGQDCQMQKNNSILFEGSFFITRIQTKTKNRAVVLKCNSFIISIGSFLFFTLPFCNSSNLYDLKYWFSVVNDVFYKLANKYLSLGPCDISLGVISQTVLTVEHCFNILQKAHGLSLKPMPKTGVYSQYFLRTKL